MISFASLTHSMGIFASRLAILLLRTMDALAAESTVAADVAVDETPLDDNADREQNDRHGNNNEDRK